MNHRNCAVCGEPVGGDHYKSVETRHKACHRESIKAKRIENHDHYVEFDKARSMRPDRVAARKAYAQTGKGKLVHAESCARYIDKNPEKRSAHKAVSNALRDGKLTKRPCEMCHTTESIEAHHYDYSKPLDVVWLCTAHHAEVHKVMKMLAA